ncbi:MAG: ABC-type branched-chain amino acid transport system periplasmic component-like protein [Mycobacterium sp.]|nr:ABC-type branched-chain amino acid transport system periplasmic component-like protein [Mycobacterium sp.]
MSRRATPWASARSRGRRGPLTLVTTPLAVGAVLALTLSACGRSGGSTPAGPATSAAGGTTASATPSSAGKGDFGSLKAICGPGTSKGNIGRGVTATQIHIGVTADPGAAAAPGLEQEFFDTADGFSKWCNAAGGINGRQIVVDKLDAKLFDVGQVMTTACQKDFMLVGNGNAFDSAGVKIRENCKLGDIPAYVVSPQAVDGTLQVQAAPVPPNYINNGALRLLSVAYPDTKTGGVGIAGSNLSSLIPTGMKAQEYLKDIGLKVPVYQAQPPLVDNYRPYMEQMKGGGARGIYIVTAQDPSPIVQAMKNVGWTPSWIAYSVQFYGPQAVAAAKATPDFPPSYVQFNAIPFELASKYPAVQQVKDIVTGAVPNAKLTSFTLSSFNAWLLWAQSATACGDTLTVDCNLAKAKANTDWTGGGLYPHLNLQTGAASSCVALVRLTPTGFVYDEKVTNPTKGDEPFNCDPENLKQVKTYVS